MPFQISLLCAHVFAAGGLALVVNAAIGFADAERALAFYGVYHREYRNQIVHFFGVPGILWSMIIFMQHLKIPLLGAWLEKQNILPSGVQLSYGLVLALFYLIFYLMIDPIGGTLYAPILYLMYSSAVSMHRNDQKKAAGETEWYGSKRLLLFALIIHVLSWYVQIHLGHQIYEGAQPAVKESLGGALTVAPLFAFYEGLWLVGINKNLQNETLRLVDKYTVDLCSSGVDMRVCNSLNF